MGILGSAPFNSMVTTAGSGWTRSDDIAVSRWRLDLARDSHGQWCYVRDLRSGKIWSAGHQPVCAEADSYQFDASPGKVTIRRQDGEVATLTEIVVIPGAFTDSRRVTIANNSSATLDVELTSYQEIVLAPHRLDRGHRAFYNLFVQTEWLPELPAVLAMRRPRSASDMPRWLGHAVAASDTAAGVSCETDRASFIGRGRSARNPAAMDNPGSLPGNVGAVLDPVAALRLTLSIAPGSSERVIFTTFIAPTRGELMEKARSFSRMNSVEPFFERVGSAEDIADSDAAACMLLGERLLYGLGQASEIPVPGAGLPACRDDLLRLGIDGELPILLATLPHAAGIRTVVELLTAHWYLGVKGLACDFVIVCANERLESDVREIIGAAGKSESPEGAGRISILRQSELSEREQVLLEIVSRVRVDARGQSLGEILDG